MTSLRGLDGIHANPEGHQKKGGTLNVRDDTVLDHFTKQVCNGLLQIDEREVFIGNPSIFDFDFSISQKNDPFQKVQAEAVKETPEYPYNQPIEEVRQSEESVENIDVPTISCHSNKSK